jgi:hypothetical protein
MLTSKAYLLYPKQPSVATTDSRFVGTGTPTKGRPHRSGDATIESLLRRVSVPDESPSSQE